MRMRLSWLFRSIHKPVLRVVIVVLVIALRTQSVSLELRLNRFAGLNKEPQGRVEHLAIVRECSPICSIMGSESLVKNEAHLLSSEGIQGSFRIAIQLRKRYRPPSDKKVEIPVEVVESEGLPMDLFFGGRPESSVQFNSSYASFDVDGRVLVTGEVPGEKGKLNHSWQEREELVAEYMIDTTVAAVRRCRRSCRFHSTAPFVQTILPNSTRDAPTFHVQLSAFQEGAQEKSSIPQLIFAGHFAEAVENLSPTDILLSSVFSEGFLPPQQSELGSMARGEDARCRQFRFLASLGNDTAYAWELSLDEADAPARVPEGLSVGNKPHLVVIAFKNIERHDPSYTETWGGNELVSVDFAGSDRHNHFRSFGKVHKGLHARYNVVAQGLKRLLRPGSNILVTGAFTGGAIAALAFSDWLSDRNLDIGRTHGVTFGASQVGDKLYQKAFRELGQFEASRVKLGYFEQLVAADLDSFKVDISSQVPSLIFHGLAPYPGIHSLDCLRSILPVERMALAAPGHLRGYRSVGRKRFLYAGRALGSKSVFQPKNSSLIGRASDTNLNDVGSTVFTISGERMPHYMERLYSLYHDARRNSESIDGTLHYSNFQGSRTGVDIRVDDESMDCSVRKLDKSTKFMYIRASISPRREEFLGDRHLYVALCEDCAGTKDNRRRKCREMFGIDDVFYKTNAIAMSKEFPSVSYVSLRPFPENACVQFRRVRLQQPSTCTSFAFSKERILESASMMIAVGEVLRCKKLGCQVEFDGMKMRLAGALLEYSGSEDGQSKGSDTVVGDVESQHDFKLNENFSPRAHSSHSDSVRKEETTDSLQRRGKRTESSLVSGADSIDQPAVSVDAALGISTPTLTGRPRIHESSISDKIFNGYERRQEQMQHRSHEIDGSLTGQRRRQNQIAEYSKPRLSCENESECKCLLESLSACAFPIPGHVGWCSKQNCDRMRCSCDGQQTCLKRESIAFNFTGDTGGVDYARCKSIIVVVPVALPSQA